MTSPSLASRWWTFTAERFSLPVHIPMVALFCLGNMAMALRGLEQGPEYSRYGMIFLLAFSFFFRLRCFDEIKDYDVDLRVNPTRPLARGVLSISEVKAMIALLCVFELLLASFAGFGPLVMHVVAMIYSFLMYNEFFIGKYLRPHLTTYAVTHTFVSMLLGWSLAAQVLGQWDRHFLNALMFMGPINWALFNLFEFARKTFAADEERPAVESYSSIFGVWGAVVLSLSQIVIALLVLTRAPLPGVEWQFWAAVIPLGGSLFFAFKKSAGAARLFRTLASVYLLVFYIVLSVQGLYL